MTRRIGLIVAFVLAACGRPPLDQGGAIRCGTEGDGGICPPEFECRWDHCCPTSSTTRTCPSPGTTYVSDPTGHAYAPVAGACPDGYEIRFDHYCCPTGSGAECPTRILGAHCTTEMQCDPPSGLTAVCLTNQFQQDLGQQFIGGYCASDGCRLDDPNSCGPNGYCTAFERGAATGVCLRSCRLATGAIVGPCDGSQGTQLCVTRGNPDDLTLGACIPDCSRPENAMQCDTAAGIQCLEAYPGLHICALPCSSSNPCPAGATCSADPGFCRASN